MKKKYELIVEYIEELVEKNGIKQGERLPSIRSMAILHNCNKSTVIRAYKELELRHKIYSIPKGGYYLVEKKPLINVEHNKIDFREVMPDPKLLPYKEFNHSINRAVELYKDNLFTYSDPQGLLSLRKTLTNHFSEYQVFTTEDKIFITTGAQQALCILSKMPFPNGKKNILVEQPTYGLMNKLLELQGGQLIGIVRDYGGIDFEELERLFKHENIKFFYTMLRFHNPLGTSYSEKDKKKIVDLAIKYDVYIVEDDYLVDIDMNKKRLPAFYYDTSERVIYVKSFSKAFMPGIRIGAVIANEALKNEFLIHKRCYDLNTSVLAQGALEIFINSGMYKRHIIKAQKEYRKKMVSLKESLKNMNSKEVEFFIPETGFFIWMRLSQRIDISILEKSLKLRNIYISQADSFFIANTSKENSFRICISKLSEEQIRYGIFTLWDEISKLIG